MNRTDITPPIRRGDPGARDLIDLDGLTVRFGKHGPAVVRDVSFRVGRGECLALVGESGSGKSVTARSLVGLAGDGSRVRASGMRLFGDDARSFSQDRWRRLRGSRVGFVLQDALASLDALRTVGREVGEPLRLHTPLTKAQREARVVELLASVGVPEPERRAAQYPHQLSGGQRQRALIASAIACGPELLIADEPTTALDATVQRQILDLLAGLKRSGTGSGSGSASGSDMGLLLITHDLAVVADLADRVAVMRDGEIVETGTVDQILGRPGHEYTRSLLAAVPSALPPRAARPDDDDGGGGGETVLDVRNVTKRFRYPDGGEHTAVDDVSFALRRGRTLGIVGESGSGKSTIGRIVAGLETPDAGSVGRHGTDWSALSRRDLVAHRRRIQLIYQDPLGSFDPRYTVAKIVGEAIPGPRSGKAARVAELLDQVGLAAGTAHSRPLLLSGGQRQRVAIARALAAEPDTIVCDEPVSALDVRVQAQILRLFARLQDELGLSYVFISHDLGVIRYISDDVIVMKDGAVVERGPVESLFADPQAGYTRELLAAIPAATAPASDPAATPAPIQEEVSPS